MAIRVGSTVSSRLSERIFPILWGSLGGLMVSGVGVVLLVEAGTMPPVGPGGLVAILVVSSALGALMGNFYDPIRAMDGMRIVGKGEREFAIPLRDPDVKSILKSSTSREEAEGRILSLAESKWS